MFGTYVDYILKYKYGACSESGPEAVRMRWDRSDLYLRAIILEFMFRRALIYDYAKIAKIIRTQTE